MINIKPINIGLPPKQAVSLKIRAEFVIGDAISTIFWSVADAENMDLAKGDLIIPTEIHDAWGVDDSIVENYVLTELGLHRL